jgi:hypothetical protein
MATLNLNTIGAAAACFDCLSETEKKEAKILLLANALKQVGGPDYTNINTLRQAVACYCVPDAVLDGYDVVVAQNLLTTVDGPTLTLAQIKYQIACWCNIQERELHAMEMLIRAGLSAYAG